jgi:hypothetical protein
MGVFKEPLGGRSRVPMESSGNKRFGVSKGLPKRAFGSKGSIAEETVYKAPHSKSVLEAEMLRSETDGQAPSYERLWVCKR